MSHTDGHDEDVHFTYLRLRASGLSPLYLYAAGCASLIFLAPSFDRTGAPEASCSNSLALWAIAAFFSIAAIFALPFAYRGSMSDRGPPGVMVQPPVQRTACTSQGTGCGSGRPILCVDRGPVSGPALPQASPDRRIGPGCLTASSSAQAAHPHRLACESVDAPAEGSSAH